jgi:predicted esterase
MRSDRILLCFLLSAGLGLRLYCCYANYPTVEEAQTIVSGFYDWQTGGLPPVCDAPPLGRMIITLPSLALQPFLPPPEENYDFQGAESSEYIDKSISLFLFANPKLGFRLIFLSRMSGIFWWAVGAWVICRWTRDLFGETSCRLSLILWCFEPNVLARSCLATTDFAVAVACLAATYAYRRWLDAPTWRNAAGAGLLLGIAQLIDFTALVLIVLWPILWIVRLAGGHQGARTLVNSGLRVRQAAIGLAIAVWAINFSYGFAGAGSLLREKIRTPNDRKDTPFGAIGSQMIPLPTNYLNGIALRLREAESQPPDFTVWSDRGPGPTSDRRRFTLSTMFAKVSIGIWLMLVWSLILTAVRSPVETPLVNVIAVWMPLAVIPILARSVPGLLVPMSSMLLVLPFAFIGVSALGRLMRPGHWKYGWPAALCLAWVVVSGLAAYPRPLGYLNEHVAASGGVGARAAHAAPGDMGQDILPLRAWLDGHPVTQPIGLACRHLVDPVSHGVAHSAAPIGAGPWAASDPWYMPRIGPYPGHYAIDLYHLSLGRYRYFLEMSPTDQVGTSLYIYHVTREVAERIRRRMGLPTLQDIDSLNVWLKEHPEARPLSLASRHAIDPRIYGLEIPRPPIDPGASLANAPWYTLPTGPQPGYFVMDCGYLSEKGYRYFKLFDPEFRIGSSFHIYHVGLAEANRVRDKLGLPSLKVPKDPPPSRNRGFVQRDFRDSQGTDSHYAIFLPSDYDGKKAYPLILFLHGYGDRGTEGQQYLAVGLPPAVERRKDSFGFIVLCPQGHSGGWSADGEDAVRAMELLDRVEGEYNVDPKRIYLTGLSSGGAGVWNMATRYPARWAAIVPVSSGGCNPAQASIIKNIPCWCFHNAHDASSRSADPERLIDAIRRLGGSPRYSKFQELFVPTLQHNAWDPAYHIEEVYQWMIMQSLPSPTPARSNTESQVVSRVPLTPALQPGF